MSIVLVVFPAAPKPSPEAQRADRELDDTLRTRITGCYHSLLHACAHKHRHHPHLDMPTPDVNSHTGDTVLHTHDAIAHFHSPDSDTHTPDTVVLSSDAVVHSPDAVTLIIDSMAHIPDIDADMSDSESKSETCIMPVTESRNVPNDGTG